MNHWLILSLLVISSTSLHLQSGNEREVIVNGWEVKNVAEADQDIDKYIREQFPELSNAKLTSTQTQVVSGMNYKYTYEDKNGVTWSITVWDQVWLKHREVTSIEKAETKTNDQGQQVEVTTKSFLETRDFTTVAKEYFKPTPSTQN